MSRAGLSLSSILSLLFLLILIAAPHALTIGACQNLSAAGTTYTLNQSINSSGTCFNITAANVTLDCAGHSLTGTGTSNAYGAYSNQTNTTIKNCIFSSQDAGILFNGSSMGAITNCSAYNSSTAGFYLLSGSNNTLFSNYAETPGAYGYYLSASSNNTLFHNNASTCQSGYFLEGSTGNNLTSNNAYDSPNYGYFFTMSSDSNSVTNNTDTRGYYGFALSDSQFNNLSSNYALNSTTAGFYLDDSAFNTLTGNSANNSALYGFYGTLSSHNLFFRNAANAPVGYGYLLETDSSNNILSGNNVSDSGDSGFAIDSGSNNTLFNNTAYNASGFGFQVFSSDSNNLSYNNASLCTSGIYLQNSQFCHLTNNSISYTINYGLFLISDSGNIITGNRVVSLAHGFFLYGTVNDTIADNLASSNSTSGSEMVFSMDSGSVSNTVANNTFNNTAEGSNLLPAMYIISSRNNLFINNTIGVLPLSTPAIYTSMGSDNNTFYWNKISSSIWISDANGSNNYNHTFENGTSAGNIYYFQNGTASWDVFGIYNDGNSSWAASGTSRPFNATTVGSYFTGAGQPQDWYPFTSNPVPNVFGNGSSMTDPANPYVTYTVRINNNSDVNNRRFAFNSTVEIFSDYGAPHNLTLGQSIYVGDFQIRLADISVAVGNDTTHPAILDFMDNASQVIGQTQVTPGDTYTFMQSETNRSIRVHVYQTRGGLTLDSKWAELSAFNETSLPLLSFNYDFGSSTLNFSQIRINSSAYGGDATPYAAVSGIDSAHVMGTKTLYLYNFIPQYDQICIKDAANVSYTDITSDCNGEAEFLITCNASVQNGYACNASGTALIISGLNHSAVMQFIPPAASAPLSSSGGGASFVLPILTYSFNCTTGALAVSLKSTPGNSLSSIFITLSDAYGSSSRTLASDADGVALFTNIASGSYLVQSAASGIYFPSSITPAPILLERCTPKYSESKSASPDAPLQNSSTQTNSSTDIPIPSSTNATVLTPPVLLPSNTSSHAAIPLSGTDTSPISAAASAAPLLSSLVLVAGVLVLLAGAGAYVLLVRKNRKK